MRNGIVLVGSQEWRGLPNAEVNPRQPAAPYQQLDRGRLFVSPISGLHGALDAAATMAARRCPGVVGARDPLPGQGASWRRSGRSSTTYAGQMTNAAAEHEQANDRRGVLVTGASRGLGAEVARTFANLRGDRVAVHCRNSRAEADAVRETLDGDGHVVVQGDLASPQDVRRFVNEAIEALGRIDVLVNNAALFADDPSTQGRRLSCDVAESSYDEWVSAWRRTTDVNLLGTANVTYQVART